MTDQKTRSIVIVAIIFLIVLFGCLQQAGNEISKEKAKEKSGEKDKVNENEDMTPLPEIGSQTETESQTTTETKPPTEFNPKSFGNPNPRSVQPHPEQCCNHPYYHYIVSAGSDNGLNWQEDSIDTVIRDHASVPDYAILDDGTHMLYFVDGVYDTLGCMESKDGKTFVEVECRIYNFTKEKVWDPNVVSIGNSTYRLFFFSPEFEPGMGQPNGFDQPKNRIFSAISKNGKDWLMESGVRYEDISITDPSVIKRTDGTWYMFVSHGNTIIQAESSDGLTFKRLQEINTIGGFRT